MPPRVQRRSRSKEEKDGAASEADLGALDCIGDRWTYLVLAAGLFGLQRFEEIASAIGIATDMPADRLRLLDQAGILDRVPYSDRPAQYQYRLSEKGRDLYGNAFAVHE